VVSALHYSRVLRLLSHCACAKLFLLAGEIVEGEAAALYLTYSSMQCLTAGVAYYSHWSLVRLTPEPMFDVILCR
jgi:hypothetical protein